MSHVEAARLGESFDVRDVPARLHGHDESGADSSRHLTNALSCGSR
jgi:hypothetical protein